MVVKNANVSIIQNIKNSFPKKLTIFLNFFSSFNTIQELLNNTSVCCISSQLFIFAHISATAKSKGFKLFTREQEKKKRTIFLLLHTSQKDRIHFTCILQAHLIHV